MTDDLVDLLEWDTGFFGFPVAQVSRDRLSVESMERVQQFCRDNRIRLLQFKCDAHHRPSVLLAEEHGFHFVDVRMIYQQMLKPDQLVHIRFPEGVTFRLGCEEDIPALKDMATDLYTHSRYYFDKNFPQDRVRLFYPDWIEKAIYGTFDSLAWVICKEDQPVGFCSARFDDAGNATIGLVGMDSSCSGKGLGAGLLNGALHAMQERDVEQVWVVTQGRNYGAQRLYQKSGFFIEKIEIYYHCWLDC